MNKRAFLIWLTALTALAGMISCQKELSCEGCAGNNKPPFAVAGPDQTIT